MQRPALLLMNGVVYAAFGAHCDIGPYNGFVVGVSVTGQITGMFATESGPQKDHGAGVWQSGGGLASDGPGRIFFVTGNGYSKTLGAPIPSSTPRRRSTRRARESTCKRTARSRLRISSRRTMPSASTQPTGTSTQGLPSCCRTRSE